MAKPDVFVGLSRGGDGIYTSLGHESYSRLVLTSIFYFVWYIVGIRLAI